MALLTFFTWASYTVLAQHRCGTGLIAPSTFNENEVFLTSKENIPNIFSAPDTLVIPVIVHNLYTHQGDSNSLDQVREQVQVLNADFNRFNTDTIKTPLRFFNSAAGIAVKFQLAARSPGGYATTGLQSRRVTTDSIGGTDAYFKTIRGGLDAWNPKFYLNIWVCYIGNRTLGFTFLPGNAGIVQDGVVLDPRAFGKSGTARSPFNLGRTTTHEVGHWLGLKHLWGDQTGCAYDDGISDTPNQTMPNTECPTGIVRSCAADGPGDMYMNYMDYTYDACQNIFTAGQVRFMDSIIHNVRYSLYESEGLTPPGSTNKVTFNVYPNPSNGTTYCIIPPYSEGKFSVWGIDGNLQFERSISNQTALPITFDASKLSPGVYVLQLDINSTRIVKKLMVIH